MQRYLLLAIAEIFLLWSGGCARQQPRPAQDVQPEYRVTSTIKEIMDSIVDPSADFIWQSVKTVSSAKGLEEKKPRTDEEWKEVRRHAIALLEATNLLKMPGRHVAKPGEKAADVQVELSPEQIEMVINKDRMAWNKNAQALYDATMEVLNAIDVKDAEALFDMGGRLDAACENCHLQYWYPEGNPPAAGAQRGNN